MKNIVGADFGVRFYRRGSQKKIVQKENPSEKVVMKNFKKSDLKMIFINRALNVFAAKRAGFFDVLKTQKAITTDTQKPKDDVSLKQKALWNAARSGDCHALRLLVLGGVDLDARDEQGRTALNIATQYNHTQAIKTVMAAKEMQRMAKLGDLPNSAFYDKFKKNKTSGGAG